MADGEWPEFGIPDIDASSGEATAPSPGETSGSAPAATEPKAAQASDTKPSDSGVSSTGEMIPKYRFDELGARLSAAEERNERMMALFAEKLAEIGKPTVEAEPDPQAERKQRILQQLIDVDPRFKDLLELGASAKDILGLLQSQKVQQQSTEQQWDDYAKTTLSAIADGFAVAAFGKGKSAKDLSPEVKRDLADAFVRWVASDDTQQRARRYDRQDETLRSEFIAEWQKRWVDPWKQTNTAQRLQQARRTANLPVAGQTNSPLGTPPAKPSDDDEDAVFHRGWAVAQQMKEQGV